MKKINISISMDNNFLGPAIVTLRSLLDSANKNTFYNIHALVSGDVKEDSKQKLNAVCNEFENNRLNIIDMGNAYQGDNITFEQYTAPIFYRLSLPSILPDEDRCIYIDIDTIINTDLGQLYDTKMDDCYVAGVKDILVIHAKGQEYADLIGIPSLASYINTGCVVLNLKKIREDNIEQKWRTYIDEKVNKNPEIIMPDQDAINSVCFGKIKHIDYKYNFVPFVEPSIDFYKALKVATIDIEFDPNNVGVSHQEYKETQKNPAIIHYNGASKPWLNSGGDALLKGFEHLNKYMDFWWNHEKGVTKEINFPGEKAV